MRFTKFNQLIVFVALITQTYLFSQSSVSFKNSSYKHVKSNLDFLASDELEGRETTTRGERIAGLFISEELKKYGVLPFGDSGTYFQNFEMIVNGLSDDSKVTFYNEEGKAEVFQNGIDVAYGSRSLPSKIYANKELEIIFAGYGIYSEEDNYDSYENIDVKGKVVLLLYGTPKKGDDEILSDEIVRKYRWTTSKSELAESKGAVGVIILPNAELLKYWDYVINRSISKSFYLVDEYNSLSQEEYIPNITLSDKAAESLLQNEELNYESISKVGDPKPQSFKLKSKVKFDYRIVKETRPTRNIIGLIEGNNPQLKNEYLTIGAHYDHEGIKNDVIFHGADDNGSGTVTVLEVARKLAHNHENNRPVLVIFNTGEEEGLKGSKYLANNSEFIKDVIVHFNVDMVGRRSEDSIYCIGASKISTELGVLVDEVNSETTHFVLDYSFDDPKDPQRLYYRSDHINYANKGIPSAFFYDNMQEDYHKTSDKADKINYAKIIKMTDLMYNLIMKISNMDHKLSVNTLSAK